MSDVRDSNDRGQVEPTPEAGPLTPPSLQDHFTGDISPTAGASSGQDQGQESAQGQGDASARAKYQARAEAVGRDLFTRSKPLLLTAGGYAAKALNLAAKGMSVAASKLEERRKRGSKRS